MDAIIIIFLFLCLGMFFVFYVSQFYNMIFRGFAPFYSTRKKIIETIADKIKIEKNDCIIELGCGRAGFLQVVRQKFPEAKLIGYEYLFLPFLMAQVQNSFQKSKLDIRNVDFFKADLSEANTIYCYLSIRTMKDLEKKFISECKPGTEIISYMFPLPSLKPVEVLDVAKGEKVYYYTI
jgi:trans-aconitate methyltransferase